MAMYPLHPHFRSNLDTLPLGTRVGLPDNDANDLPGTHGFGTVIDPLHTIGITIEDMSTGAEYTDNDGNPIEGPAITDRPDDGMVLVMWNAAGHSRWEYIEDLQEVTP